MGPGLWAAVRLDLGEVLRSRWMLFCAAVYLALGAIFVLVGLRESLVLGFTGLGRVLFSLCHALVLVLPLLALTGAGPAVVRSREEGSLEFWLSQPIGRGAWLVGVTAVRYLALALPLAAVLGGLALWAPCSGPSSPWASPRRCACAAWRAPPRSCCCSGRSRWRSSTSP
jgi:ABC-2 type transport system permease protein